MKYCPSCTKAKPLADWYVNAGRKDGLSPYCAVCMVARSKDSRDKLRLKVIQHLGGQCVQCGYNAVGRPAASGSCVCEV